MRIIPTSSILSGFIIFSLLFLPETLFSGLLKADNEIHIMPKPNSIIYTKGRFILNENVKILSNDSLSDIIGFLQSQIKELTSLEIKTATGMSGYKLIKLIIDKNTENTGSEEYSLLITPNEIIISSHSAQGIFRGVSTLLQLLPIDSQGKSIHLSCCKVIDKPAYSWRGLNLDCSRHFMTKDFIKRYIDILAIYKFNKFHWHFTDDQGWRIEIKKYPKLTKIGALRKEADGSVYGGYYTQEDIKEIVDYAKKRFIDVIPEIEMPGHSLASLASYPENSCTGGPFDVINTWGVMKDVYCAGKDSTFIFLQNILDEIIELFPYEYIHIGGDEVPKDRWKACEKCQKRISEENLKDEAELQTYFITRIADYLKTKNRKIIGWEEILEGGLTKGATVQSWTGFKGAITAANLNHQAICSPYSHTYLNSDPKDLDIKTCYSFIPVPPELSGEKAQFICGSEANLWTENAPQETVDSKLFPRLLALSEVFWTNHENKNYKDFYKRLQNHYNFLKKTGIKFGREGKAISYTTKFDNSKKLFIASFKAEEKDIVLRYTLNGDTPAINSPILNQPLYISNNAVLKVSGFKFNHPVFTPITLNFSSHKGLGASVGLTYPYAEKYSANGANSLTDGIRGLENFREGNWQGFEGTDMEAVIDLGKEMTVSKIAIDCLQDASSWIFFPTEVSFYISDDNLNFRNIATEINDYPLNSSQPIIKTFSTEFDRRKCRYIKVYAKGLIKCPDWHPGAGEKAWIFTDEIIVD